MPRVEAPMSLICGACGASGKYDVGTVTFDPMLAKSPDRDDIEKAVGFTGYFRCRKCDAGGPWELPNKTLAQVTMLMVAASSDRKDVPLVLGCIATFDSRIFRYATECEAHLKGLIDQEPERAFLWVRLGNLYSHSGQREWAQTAFERAIELDPEDIEAHGMFGQLLVQAGRPLEAVPHWHVVLEQARNARNVQEELRRNLVRGAIECLLEAHAESNGQIDLLPTVNPDELEKRREDEPVVIELREFDLGTEEGIEGLCDMFVEQPRRPGRGLFRGYRKRMLEASHDRPATRMYSKPHTVGRNDRCPCGSGHKYKKCCGR